MRKAKGFADPFVASIGNFHMTFAKCLRRYNHLLDSGAQCMAIQETVDAVLEVSMVLKAFYMSPSFQEVANLPPWKWELSLASPSDEDDVGSNKNASFSNTQPRPTDDRNDFASSSFYFVLDNVAKPMLGEEGVHNISRSFAGFFTMDSSDRSALTAGNLIRNSMVCDFEAVTFCHKGGTRRNLVASFVMAYVMYMVAAAILDATAFTSFLSPFWRSVMFVVVVPGMGFYLAYGVGPSCFPMVPTCLMQDVILHVQQSIPIKIVWPNSLQKSPGCLGNATSLYGKQQCMRSCRGHPFHFRSWESSLSWAVCAGLAADPAYCQNGTQHMWFWPSFLPRVAELEIAMQNHSAVLRSADRDLWHGHQFCFFFTLGQAIPYMFLALVIGLGAMQLLKMPLAFIAAATQFLWQAAAFTHSE